MSFLDLLLFVLTFLLLVPLLVLIVECFAARPLAVSRETSSGGSPRPRCAVLIPAHDEAAGIGKTIATIKPQLGPEDDILVVADNCTDRTAGVAQEAGAEVVERRDEQKRGKGYALDHGMNYLAKTNPPNVVVIVDADCHVHDGCLDVLVRQAATTGKPAQAVYVMAEAPGAGPKQQLSAFAFLFKNLVRPLGLAQLGMPCLLTGSGMAFPFTVLRAAALASGNLVEDMQLGIDLALMNYAPRLCPTAQVSSELPTGDQASLKQRSRWEHGHVKTALTQVPRLLIGAVVQFRLDLVGLALELSVLPLSLLFLGVGVTLLLSLLSLVFGGSPWPVVILLLALVGVLAGIFRAWSRFGRDRLPLSVLLLAPVYVLWKVPLYLAMVFRPQRTWERTERTSTSADKPA
jgi:cellulose synthase/poly-beta-1,6-N-acetylglucosamine synthase-like glycosyltransferase